MASRHTLFLFLVLGTSTGCENNDTDSVHDDTPIDKNRTDVGIVHGVWADTLDMIAYGFHRAEEHYVVGRDPSWKNYGHSIYLADKNGESIATVASRRDGYLLSLHLMRRQNYLLVIRQDPSTTDTQNFNANLGNIAEKVLLTAEGQVQETIAFPQHRKLNRIVPSPDGKLWAVVYYASDNDTTVQIAFVDSATMQERASTTIANLQTHFPLRWKDAQTVIFSAGNKLIEVHASGTWSEQAASAPCMIPETSSSAYHFNDGKKLISPGDSRKPDDEGVIVTKIQSDALSEQELRCRPTSS